MADTQTNPQDASRRTARWTVEELYDLIMYDIEPELLSSVLPGLEELYKDETKEQHDERMARYRMAFALFYERFDMLLSIWKEELEVFRKEAFRRFEEKVHVEEQGGASSRLDDSSSQQ